MKKKRLVKGKEVVVNWKSSYYRGFVMPSNGIYMGKIQEEVARLSR